MGKIWFQICLRWMTPTMNCEIYVINKFKHPKNGKRINSISIHVRIGCIKYVSNKLGVQIQAIILPCSSLKKKTMNDEFDSVVEGIGRRAELGELVKRELK